MSPGRVHANCLTRALRPSVDPPDARSPAHLTLTRRQSIAAEGKCPYPAASI